MQASPNLRRLGIPPAVLLTLLIGSCSGSSSGGHADPGPSSKSPIAEAHLRGDTTGGLPGRLSGRVAAVALENDQGQLTGNLASGSPELVLSDPLGASTGFELADFGPGSFVAVHISFVPDTLTYQTGSAAAEPVSLVGGSIRAEFHAAFDVQRLGAWWFDLRHRAAVELVEDPQSRLSWTPDMEAEAGRSSLLRDARIEVVSVDQGKGTLDGRLLDLDGMATQLRFTTQAVLVLDGVEVDTSNFLAGLTKGDVLQVFGLLDRSSQCLTVFAERFDTPTAGNGNGKKNRIRGTIESVNKNLGTASVKLFEILIGGKSLPSTNPLMLAVDANRAKIKWVPRYGSHLPPHSLSSGMYVGIEWHGAAPTGAVAAHKINIRSDGRLPFLHQLEGEIQSIDLQGGTLVMRTRGSNYLFGKESYLKLTLSFAPDALIVADSKQSVQLTDLAGLRVGERIQVQGSKLAGGALDLSLLIVLR